MPLLVNRTLNYGRNGDQGDSYKARHNNPPPFWLCRRDPDLLGKLRWIGMEKEAETLAEELAQRRITDAVSVIAPSRETD